MSDRLVVVQIRGDVNRNDPEVSDRVEAAVWAALDGLVSDDTFLTVSTVNVETYNDGATVEVSR